MSTLLPDESCAAKELTGKVLSAEQRKVIERMAGCAGLSDEERAKQVALDRASHEGTIFAVLREALHVLDHGGELARECREKIEDWISGDAMSLQGQATRALVQAIDKRQAKCVAASGDGWDPWAQPTVGNVSFRLAGAVRGRRYALSFCDDRPFTSGERRVLQRRLPIEAAGLPIRAIALLAGGDRGCLPRGLRVNGEEVDVWSRSGSCWYAEGPGSVAFDAGAQVSLEVGNNGTTSARFHGVLLLGDWSRESGATRQLFDAVREPCRDGGPCTTPLSGGACPGCDYPRAYVHPDSLLDAFRVDDVYVRGTAMTVYPDHGVSPGLVQIIQRDGSQYQHAIPSIEGRMLDVAIVDSMLANTSPAQLGQEGVSPLAALGSGTAADLLEASARLLRTAGFDSSRRGVAQVLIEGVANLIASRHSSSARRELRLLLEGAPYLSAYHDPALDDDEARTIRPIATAVRTLLRELDRDDRIQSVARAPRDLLLVDDRRPRVNWLCEGPFPRPVSRIRVALLPGEADHVRIYDLKVGTRDAYPIGTSVLDRVPGYGPDTVREDGPPVDLGSRVTRRYLPGSLLAGRLRDGANPWNPDDPYTLRPEDLIGGVWVELATTLPSLSYAYLIYDVDPGHAMVAVVKPE